MRRQPVRHNPGWIVLSDTLKIVRTNPDCFHLRVPSCRALATAPRHRHFVSCCGLGAVAVWALWERICVLVASICRVEWSCCTMLTLSVHVGTIACGRHVSFDDLGNSVRRCLRIELLVLLCVSGFAVRVVLGLLGSYSARCALTESS